MLLRLESSADRFLALMNVLVLRLLLPVRPRLLSFLARRSDLAMFGWRRLRRSSVWGSGSIFPVSCRSSRFSIFVLARERWKMRKAASPAVQGASADTIGEVEGGTRKLGTFAADRSRSTSSVSPGVLAFRG